jgi:hypothetical protein
MNAGEKKTSPQGSPKSGNQPRMGGGVRLGPPR